MTLACMFLAIIGLLVSVQRSQEVPCEADSKKEGQCVGPVGDGPDAMSLMQGANVRVDLLGGMDLPRRREHKTEKASRPAPLPASSKATFFQAAIVRATEHMKTRSALPVVLIVLLLGGLLCCLAALLLRRAGAKGAAWGAAWGATWGLGAEGAVPETQAQPLRSSPILADRAAAVQLSPSVQQGRLSTSAFSDRSPPQQPMTTMSSSRVQGPPPPIVASTQQRQEPAGVHFRAPPLSKQAPPPLCPTLVMPVCEARFGVPMQELANITGGPEGEIGIVGLSGNPLLRAVLRADSSQQRFLEIRMPEKNSAPRSTVGPASPNLGRSLEIRGMKDAYYGTLEMRQSGPCYVIKDGQSVLVIDGDTDNLQLGVKSGAGSQLASVRCCAEPFGGVEHVEIRVEPGVDTVLILAVVLGVLLLSPFLPPDPA